MSTRATVHFCGRGTVQAIVYRHSDGYPEGLGADLQDFFKAVREQSPGDTRFNDATFLAARFVVWQTLEYVRDDEAPLAVIGVGVYLADPGDVEFRYLVRCVNDDIPVVECVKIRG